jgi:hypothetical protein
MLHFGLARRPDYFIDFQDGLITLKEILSNRTFIEQGRAHTLTPSLQLFYAVAIRRFPDAVIKRTCPVLGISPNVVSGGFTACNAP